MNAYWHSTEGNENTENTKKSIVEQRKFHKMCGFLGYKEGRESEFPPTEEKRSRPGGRSYRRGVRITNAQKTRKADSTPNQLYEYHI